VASVALPTAIAAIANKRVSFLLLIGNILRKSEIYLRELC
jgi:hypothetical protein